MKMIRFTLLLYQGFGLAPTQNGSDLVNLRMSRFLQIGFLLGSVEISRLQFLILIWRNCVLFLFSEDWMFRENEREMVESFPVNFLNHIETHIKSQEASRSSREFSSAITGPHRTVEIPPSFYIFMIWKLFFVIGISVVPRAIEMQCGHFYALQVHMPFRLTQSSVMSPMTVNLTNNTGEHTI